MNQPEASNTTFDKAQKRRWFILLLVIGLAATGLCIYFSVINLTRPYIGATLKFENQQWVVHSVEDSGLAKARDIRPEDVVISVNGQEPADFPKEYIDLEDYAPQAVKELVVKRKSSAEIVEISVDDSPIPPDTRLEAVILFIISFLFLAIGFFVFIKKGLKRYSTVFYLANMAVGLEFVAVAARERNLFLSFELQIVTLIILPWLVAHLFWVFPARKTWLPRLPRAEYLLYVPCIIMVILFFTGGHSAGLNVPWFSTTFAVNLALGLLFALIFIFHSYITATVIKIKQQTKIIFVGMLLGILPLLLLVVFPDIINDAKIVSTPIASLSLLLIPLSIGYTIVKYQLMDIKVMIKKGTIYLLLNTIVALPYVLVIYLAAYYLDHVWLAPVLISLLIILALGMNPIWGRVQNRVNRWFYRQHYSFLANLERFNQEVHSISDIGKFGSSVVELLNQALPDTHISLLLLAESQRYNVIATTEGNSAHVDLDRTDRAASSPNGQTAGRDQKYQGVCTADNAK